MIDPYVKVDPSLLEDDRPPLDAYITGRLIEAELARVRVVVDPLVAELKPSERFLEELDRLVREASVPRYVPHSWVPVDVLVTIAGDRRFYYNPRDRHGYPSRIHRALNPCAGFTRHTLGAHEAARDWRRHR